MTQTIAEQIKWDFGANGSFLVIKDTNGKLIYFEDSSGFWNKWKFNSNGNQIYTENSSGFWEKTEYDSEGCLIYLQNSSGIIKDNRPKPSEDRLIEIDGVKYKLIKL
jgi:hypothetical protein